MQLKKKVSWESIAQVDLCHIDKLYSRIISSTKHLYGKLSAEKAQVPVYSELLAVYF